VGRYNKKIQDDDANRAYVKRQLHTLRAAQASSLERKIAATEWRIAEAIDRFGVNGVAISYSTGKDSAVLSHIARQLYPDILHVFANTRCEYPESIRLYLKQRNEFNLIMSMPADGWNFKRVVDEYGYPLFSKDIARTSRQWRKGGEDTKAGILQHMQQHKKKYIPFLDTVFLSDECCGILKHGPIEKLVKKQGIKCSIIGTLAEESMLRRMSWVEYGCNVFDNTRHPRSRPLSVWTEKDIWNYIIEYGVEISDLYMKGYKRNGCMFCGFGVHLEKPPNRIQRLAVTHPASYEYLVKNFAGYFEACGINIKPL
jgi:3'-phosphoadenosine 5'-phosphosulfate sulfotransferase (PAPS reductase)/FAD synthetase